MSSAVWSGNDAVTKMTVLDTFFGDIMEEYHAMHRRLVDNDRWLRHAFEFNPFLLPPEMIANYLDGIRDKLEIFQQFYDEVAHGEWNDVVSLAWKELLAERNREREEMIAFWEGALRRRAS